MDTRVIAELVPILTSVDFIEDKTNIDIIEDKTNVKIIPSIFSADLILHKMEVQFI